MAEFDFGDVPVLETTSGKLKGYFYNGEYIFNDYYKGTRWTTAYGSKPLRSRLWWAVCLANLHSRRQNMIKTN